LFVNTQHIIIRIDKRMNKLLIALLLALLAGVVTAEVFFDEEFKGDWESRWIKSESREDNGKIEGDAEHGLKTTQDARFYQYSASFPAFSNRDKTLVFQYEIRHGQNIDCGGGYLKLLPAGYDPKKFNGDTPYAIMFGPDICGGTKRTHVIFTYKGKNHLIKNDIPCEHDTFSHVYTLIVKPDQTFQVLIDNEEKRSGKLTEAFDFLPSKEINDPNAKKPEDWVDSPKIADPTDVKPEGYDTIAQQIPDPDAKKPEDWDDDLDGEWTAPMIDNPEFKGQWKPKMIDNPDYKGPWVHPQVPNPDYVEDDDIHAFDNLAGVGIEIWQVKSGTTFDNILVTDDEKLARKEAEESIADLKEQKAKKEKEDEEQRKKFEEERKKEEEKKKEEDANKKDDDKDDDKDDHKDDHDDHKDDHDDHHHKDDKDEL
jgi:calreticulin